MTDVCTERPAPPPAASLSHLLSLAGTDVQLTLTFNMPFEKISSNIAAFSYALEAELRELTQLPPTHVQTASVKSGSVIAVVDVFFDAALLRTYAEATTFAMNSQVSPIALTRSAFNAQYAPVYSCLASIRPRFAGEWGSCFWDRVAHSIAVCWATG